MGASLKATKHEIFNSFIYSMVCTVAFIYGVVNKMAAEKLPWGLKSKGIAPGSMKVSD